MEKLRCQSCGMPLGEGFWSENEDGSQNTEYCRFCFVKGKFSNPTLTVDEMIQTSVTHMMQELHFSQEKAEMLAHATIPTLKRWQSVTKAS